MLRVTGGTKKSGGLRWEHVSLDGWLGGLGPTGAGERVSAGLAQLVGLVWIPRVKPQPALHVGVLTATQVVDREWMPDVEGHDVVRFVSVDLVRFASPLRLFGSLFGSRGSAVRFVVRFEQAPRSVVLEPNRCSSLGRALFGFMPSFPTSAVALSSPR